MTEPENKVIEIIEKIKPTSHEQEIRALLETIRPYLMRDGGDVSFVKEEDYVVYLKFHGACAGCSIQEITFGTIRDRIMSLSQAIKEVVVIEDAD